MNKNELNTELSLEEYVEILRNELEDQKEIFEMSEMAGDLSGMAISFNKISEIEHKIEKLVSNMSYDSLGSHSR